MATILLINECFSDNIGDQAIAAAMKLFFEQRGYNVIAQDFSCAHLASWSSSSASINYYRKTIRNITPKLLKKFYFIFKSIRTIRTIQNIEFDFAVIGGGQLILENSNFPLSMYLWTRAIKKQNKKIYILCAGAGEAFSRTEKTLYKLAFENVEKILLRDQQSIKTVAKYFDINARQCPDIVYYLHKLDLRCPSRRLNFCPSISLICPTEFSVFLRYMEEMGAPKLTQAEYISDWVSIINKELATGNNVLLSATTSKDLEISKVIMSSFYISDRRVNITSKVPTFYEFMNLAATCEVVIAGRMHALILAHLSGATPIPYKISRKLTSFSEEYLSRSPAEIKASIEESLTSVLGEIKYK